MGIYNIHHETLNYWNKIFFSKLLTEEQQKNLHLTLSTTWLIPAIDILPQELVNLVSEYTNFGFFSYKETEPVIDTLPDLSEFADYSSESKVHV